MNPTTGIADCCACAASGHATTVLLKNLMNSRRLMGPRRGLNRVNQKTITFLDRELCRSSHQAGPQPCPLWVKSGHRSGVRPCWWTGSGGGFDRLLGVVVLILHRAHVAERGVESTRVVDLIDEAWKVSCNVI